MQLNVRTWGPEGAPECLLLHGITSNAGSWTSVGPELARRGLRAIAPELRGHGESPRGEDYQTATLVQDLLESVPAEPALVVGHSFGGYLAQWAILRGLLRPRSTLLEDPVSVQPNQESPLASLDTDEHGIERSVAGILAREPRWSGVDAAWKVLSLEQVDWDGARRAFAGNAPWDLRADAVTVARQAPTIWVVPGVSRFVPEPDVTALRLAVGDDRVVVVPDVGHSIHRDDLPLFLSVVTGLLQEAGVSP
jgi:pimeloyl-ACP methyl ester carboxylesterase